MNKIFTRSAFVFILIITHLDINGQVKYAQVSPNPFPALMPGTTNNQFFAADFDKDGDTDLVFWNGTLDHYYKNNGNGTFTIVSDNTQTPFSGIRMPVFGLDNTVMQDFDDDGDMDILYYDDLLHFHIYLKNTGSAYIQDMNPFANFIAGNNWASSTVNQFLPGDFDNDGDVDMLYSTGTSNKYYKNNGGGTFTHYDDLTNSPFASLPSTSIPTRGLQYLVKADFDTDDDIDIYFFDPLTGVHHYLQNNNGVFTEAVSPFSSVIDGVNGGSGTGYKFHAGDFDADGDVDLVFWTPTVNQYYTNNGNGTFRFFSDFMNTPFEGVNGPVYGVDQSQIMDIDSDGDLDVLTNEGPVYSLLSLNGAPPKIQNVDPLNAALNVPINKSLVLQFSSIVNVAGGNIYLYKASDHSLVETISTSSANISGSGTNTITIDPANDLLPATKYYVLFDYNAFKDPLGRAFGVLDLELKRTTDISDPSFYSFTTVSAVLPIKLKSFEAKRQLDGVKLIWETAVELNAKEIIIERSMDGNVFSVISVVHAQGKPSSYDFLDLLPAYATGYYRLKLVDLDGSFQYSHIVKIFPDKVFTSIAVYPNPVRSGHSFSIVSSFKEGNLQLMGMNGSLLMHKKWKSGELISTEGLPAGMYVLQINFNSRTEQIKIVVY